MCYYERVVFVACGHEDKRLVQHCHFARNDPNHQCFGAWNYRRQWVEHETECDSCTRQRRQLKAHDSAVCMSLDRTDSPMGSQ
ncbi:hypothetical protein P153DRAFT_17835 [Dothidotthia symphoricarpi CBS 119687]|uniref:Uncharacterized protein n=1 Tax=Dothidotthia symphoricarpi CBS 119687 TaxID=1392245 RepID=A0A6A6AEF9_9PLEO|nr:uncharacterized protein P153DRAFT_17835 [Dothidotthia symphoricarpi CBS 119687]KAF2129334.1 hypothetical protein P153DRAFT_17835 [Dothidotthia symphoricarpi CBS 119687]